MHRLSSFNKFYTIKRNPGADRAIRYESEEPLTKVLYLELAKLYKGHIQDKVDLMKDDFRPI